MIFLNCAYWHADSMSLLKLRRIFVVIFMAFGLLSWLQMPVQATNFLVTNTNDNGAGSLRQAITEANGDFANNKKTNLIAFRIGRGRATIQPLSALPVITGHVVLNGATQPGFAGKPLIEISGALAPNSTSGLEFRVSNAASLHSVAKDLVINRFSKFEAYGIRIGGQSARVRIFNCYIGTTSDGLSAAANSIGVAVQDEATQISIGGAGNREGNVISGNGEGLQIVGPQVGPSSVQGNLIGTDASGTRAITTGSTGIRLANSSRQTIGGLSANARNIISGHTVGILLIGSNNVIEGNYIGLNRAGTSAISNYIGIYATSSVGNRIGGSVDASRNVISGNSEGIGFDSHSHNNVVQGNFIGVLPTGKQPLCNSTQGISISGNDNLIGGESPGSRNIIASGRDAISIGGSVTFSGIQTRTNSTGNRVLGNWIGVGLDGTSLGVGRHGIKLEGAAQNVIGGTAAGQANVIAHCSGNGIVVRSLEDSNEPPATQGNTLRGNRIFANSGLAINLQPPGEDNNTATPNDVQSAPFDADQGPNDLQNTPELLSAGFGYGRDTFEIPVRLRSTPNTKFTIDFYKTDGFDADGNAQDYIGYKTVLTDANGVANYLLKLPQTYGGTTIAATATNPVGSTSEITYFGTGGVLYLDRVVHLSAASYRVDESAGVVEITIVREGRFESNTVSYRTSSGTAQATVDYRETQGTVNFSPGQTVAKVFVPIVNDGLNEGDETFRFEIINAVGLAFIGAPQAATIIIVDDDTESD